jgi:hypothetical protein
VFQNSDTSTLLLLYTRLDIDFQGRVRGYYVNNSATRHCPPPLCSIYSLLTILETSSRWTIHLRKSTSSFSSAVLTSRALFENYDQDLKQLISSLKGKLEGDVKQLKGGMYSLSPGSAGLTKRTEKICSEESFRGT